MLLVALDTLVMTGSLKEVGDDVGSLATELVDTLVDKILKVTFLVKFATLFIILATREKNIVKNLKGFKLSVALIAYKYPLLLSLPANTPCTPITAHHPTAKTLSLNW